MSEEKMESVEIVNSLYLGVEKDQLATHNA